MRSEARTNKIQRMINMNVNQVTRPLPKRQHVDITRLARLQQDHAHLHHRHPKSHPINDIDPGRGLIRHAKSPPLIDVNAPVLVPEIQKDLGSDLVQEKDIRVPGKDDIPQMTDPTAEGGPVIRGDDRMMLLYSLCFNVPE